MTISNFFRQVYYKGTGYSFTHMGRLFLRMFVGIMLAQYGIRQLMYPMEGDASALVPLLSYGLSTWLIIIVEIICPFMFMIGFFTRISILPPFVLMIVSAAQVYHQGAAGLLGDPSLCISFLFMGIFMFLLLVGPGKISVDYFYSLYLIHRHKGKEEELELV